MREFYQMASTLRVKHEAKVSAESNGAELESRCPAQKNRMKITAAKSEEMNSIRKKGLTWTNKIENLLNVVIAKIYLVGIL